MTWTDAKDITRQLEAIYDRLPGAVVVNDGGQAGPGISCGTARIVGWDYVAEKTVEFIRPLIDEVVSLRGVVTRYEATKKVRIFDPVDADNAETIQKLRGNLAALQEKHDTLHRENKDLKAAIATRFM